MVKARKYVVKKAFQGLPKRDDYEIVEEELRPLADGEILVKTEYISVDPYLRAYHSRCVVPYDQFSFNVGTVQDSKDPEFPVGSKVVSHKGWVDYYIISKKKISEGFLDTYYKLPDLQGLPASYGVGSVGMPGATAYFGFLEICKPKAGETVVVTGAAGAVGSLVGQIAKIKGCKVIGFAGTDEKCKWLVNELGFDKAYNYKTADINNALTEAAPNGVDCYFDNVGGEISSIIMNRMNDFGRVSVCGAISVYNEDVTKAKEMPKASIIQPALVFKQLKVEDFLVTRWKSKWNEAFGELIPWIKQGKLKVQEHVTVGFDKCFDAFIGMLNGENRGKAVIKV